MTQGQGELIHRSRLERNGEETIKLHSLIHFKCVLPDDDVFMVHGVIHNPIAQTQPALHVCTYDRTVSLLHNTCNNAQTLWGEPSQV